MDERIIRCTAPTRICDNGGWTDTWFAGRGQVFNVAVWPGVEVQLRISAAAQGGAGRVTVHAENYGQRYELSAAGRAPHPLVAAAFRLMPPPRGIDVAVTIFSEMPAGCSTGTSAALCVALAGALDCLTPGRLSAHELAGVAHRVESELSGQECGVQDQLAAAYGGVNYIEIDPYPHASVNALAAPAELQWEFECRLALIYIGRPHSSGSVHRSVIERLGASGPRATQLSTLRHAARQARDAWCRQDLVELGRAMIANTDAQAELHPGLVGERHRRVIEIARAHGSLGWKVNGAGGDGGSVAIIGPADTSAKRAMVQEIATADLSFREVPVRLSPEGVRRWESPLGGRLA